MFSRANILHYTIHNVILYALIKLGLQLQRISCGFELIKIFKTQVTKQFYKICQKMCYFLKYVFINSNPQLIATSLAIYIYKLRSGSFVNQ